ncbi:hypothetical protein EN829_064165, partial [Mesorhizobium sp. M00.F.Ca.ET.186.01.1.1]
EGKVTGASPVHVQVMYKEQPIAADVNDRGGFRLVLNRVEEGKQKLTVIATDSLGREVRAEMNVIGKRKQ